MRLLGGGLSFPGWLKNRASEGVSWSLRRNKASMRDQPLRANRATVPDWNLQCHLVEVLGGTKPTSTGPRETWTPRPSVGTSPCPILALHWPSWKPVRKDVGPSLPENTTAPRRHAESVCRQGGQGKVFVGCLPIGQAGRWPWLLWPEGNNPFFPGPGHRAKAVPPFWGGPVYRYPLRKNLENIQMQDVSSEKLLLFLGFIREGDPGILYLLARIWKKSRLKSTIRGLSWWQGLPYSISRLILLPWIQTASVRL